MNKAKTLISACSKQRDQLQYISTHLPARLPEAVTSRPLQQTAGTSAPAKDSLGDEVSDADENLDSANVEPQPTSKAANDKKKRPKAPRRFPAVFYFLSCVLIEPAVHFCWPCGTNHIAMLPCCMSMSLGISSAADSPN